MSYFAIDSLVYIFSVFIFIVVIALHMECCLC